MGEILIRFVVGGLCVSVFAILGDVFKPKSFAGLFGAAPSIALATLALTVAKNGGEYAAIEAKSMMIGAVAFLLYASSVSWIGMRHSHKTIVITLGGLPLWLAAALGLWYLLLK